MFGVTRWKCGVITILFLLVVGRNDVSNDVGVVGYRVVWVVTGGKVFVLVWMQVSLCRKMRLSLLSTLRRLSRTKLILFILVLSVCCVAFNDSQYGGTTRLFMST